MAPESTHAQHACPEHILTPPRNRDTNDPEETFPWGSSQLPHKPGRCRRGPNDDQSRASEAKRQPLYRTKKL